MAAEEQLQDSAASEEVSVSVTEEKEFPLDPSLLALSGNDMQHYCTLLSLLEFQNIKPLMLLKTKQGEMPLQLVKVVEEFEAGPWLYEDNESMPFDLPQQGSPGPQVQIQYNFMLHSEGDILQENPPSCWTVPGPEQGTDLQISENESVASGENLRKFSPILMGNANAALQQQEGLPQSNKIDLTAGQENTGPASEWNNTQNVSGLDLLPGNDVRTGGCCSDHGEGEVSIHQISPQEERSSSCNSSGETGSEPPVVLERLRTRDGEVLCPCPLCGGMLSLNGNLVIHQLPHTGEELYKCPSCGYLFSRYIPGSAEGPQATLTDDWERLFHQLDLKHHPSLKADGLKKRFHCPDCGKGFVHKSSIRRHQKLHRKENLSQNLQQEKSCSLAGNQLCSPEAQFRKNPLSCPDSGSDSAGQKSQVAALCEVCGRSFSVDYKFQKHLATHFQKRPFCCGHCEKTFAAKWTLARHLLLHQPEKPFQCRYCDKSYIQKSHLNRHCQANHETCE